MLIVWLIKLKVSLIHLNIWTFRWSYLILTGSNEPWSPKLGGLPQTPLHTMTGQLSACWLSVDICSVYTSSAIAHPALPMSSIYFTWLMRGSKRIIFTILRPHCHHFFFLKMKMNAPIKQGYIFSLLLWHCHFQLNSFQIHVTWEMC